MKEAYSARSIPDSGWVSRCVQGFDRGRRLVLKPFPHAPQTWLITNLSRCWQVLDAAMPQDIARVIYRGMPTSTPGVSDFRTWGFARSVECLLTLRAVGNSSPGARKRT